ncbi:MAG: ATP-binding protein [Anaerolineae bacterium]|nr:ATP-binding protein [Anaerolineae bacterium]
MPVDLSASYYDQYQHAMRQAEKALANGYGARAASAYRRAADYLEKYAGYVTNTSALKMRATQLRQLADRVAEGVPPSAPAQPVTEEGAGDADGLRQQVVALIQRAEVTWDDIAGLEATKREIKTAYALTMARKPAGVRIDAPRTLLLYGPPGTGKTLLAAATSNGLDATFFSVRVSDVLSKYFGESSRLVGALYAEARERTPAVVFLDEFDAISRARGESGESGAERRLLATLLSELDGLNTKSDPAFVLTVAATNRPWDLDSAVRSRFAREVHVPLPDDAARRRILEIQLPQKGHQVDVSLDDLVERSAGYSGREIAQICEQAVAHMIQRLNQDLEALVDQGRDAVSAYELAVAPLLEEDFTVGLAAVGAPETTAADLARFARWCEEGG